MSNKITPTPQQINAYVQTLKAISETVKESPQGAPTGVMYAALMGRMTLQTFNGMLDKLVNMGFIRIDGLHVAHYLKVNPKA